MKSKKASKFAFLVTATKGYEKPVTALINSINKYHNTIDIIVYSRKGIADSIPTENVDFRLLPDNLSDVAAGINYRWLLFKELKEYAAICLVDADMFFVRNASKFFNLAGSTNSVISTSDCTNIYYNEPYRNKIPGLLKANFYNTKTICAVPIFVNPQKHADMFSCVFEITQNSDSIDDLLCLNMILSANKEIWDAMLVLPAYAWTGIHHTQLKPETRIRSILNQYVSEAGDEVFMIHGRWFDKKWVAGLRITMQGYFKNHFNMNETQMIKYMHWVDDSIAISLAAYQQNLKVK